jgi:hypothetical protein
LEPIHIGRDCLADLAIGKMLLSDQELPGGMRSGLFGGREGRGGG